MPTVSFKPAIKISRLMTSMRTADEIKDQSNQNDWIDIGDFNLVECFNETPESRIYDYYRGMQLSDACNVFEKRIYHIWFEKECGARAYQTFTMR